MKLLTSALRDHGTSTTYRRDSAIYYQGEVPKHALIVLGGVVKAYTFATDGSELIIQLYGKGSVLPAAWLNNHSHVALFNYSSVTDVRAIRITRSNFMDCIHQKQEYLDEYLSQTTASQAGLLLRITGLTQSRAIEKICYTLYFLVFNYGLERPEGLYEIDLKLTQSMLASMIGQTRESTAKNLKMLREQSIVRYTSSTYFVDMKRLELYLGEDGFRNTITNR